MHIYDIIRYADARVIRKIGTIRARRVSRFMIGALPVFGAFWFVVNVVMQITIGESWLLGLVFKHSFLWLVLITFLSIAYEFCWVHRAFVLYDYLISISIEHNVEVGFGEWLYPLRVVKIVVGLLLIFIFVHNNCWREFIKKQEEFK